MGAVTSRAREIGRAGARAVLELNRGLLGLSAPVQAWLLLLILANMVVPLFYLGRLEARVSLAAFMVSFMLMAALTGLFGFNRLLGLGHILWIPLVYFLWTRLEHHPAGDLYGIWLRSLMILDSVSLVLDAIEVVRFAAGDRQRIGKHL